MMPTGEDGVCYQNGEVVEENYQMCEVTNKKIRDLLGPQQIPQVTFTCNKETEACDFQCKFLASWTIDARLLTHPSLGPATGVVLLHPR